MEIFYQMTRSLKVAAPTAIGISDGKIEIGVGLWGNRPVRPRGLWKQKANVEEQLGTSQYLYRIAWMG